MKTLEQQRANNALSRVRELDAEQQDKFKKLYRSYVDRLGPTIVMNGLGQALAAEYAASGENPSTDIELAHRKLYISLEMWLCRDGGVYSTNQKLLDAITKNDESLYLRAQVEALAWLVWHKKFCRAFFPKSEEDAT